MNVPSRFSARICRQTNFFVGNTDSEIKQDDMLTKQPGRIIQNEIHPICRKLTFEPMPDGATSDAQSSSPKLTTTATADVPLCEETKMVRVGRKEGDDKVNGSGTKKKIDFRTPEEGGNKNYQSKVNIYFFYIVLFFANYPPASFCAHTGVQGQ